MSERLTSLHSGSPGWRKTLTILFIGQLLTAVGFSSFFPFLPFYVEELGSVSGLSTELLVGLVFSAQAFTMMLASPFWGALADRYGRTEILADVYLAMTGGQTAFQLSDASANSGDGGPGSQQIRRLGAARPALPVIRATTQERAAHESQLDAIAASSGGRVLWRELAERN